MALLTGLVDAGSLNDVVFVDNYAGQTARAVARLSLADERQVPGLHDLIEGKQVQLETLATPDARAVPGWIQRRAQERRIAIDGRAVQLLATYVGAEPAPVGQRTGEAGDLCGGTAHRRGGRGSAGERCQRGA